MPEIKYAVCIDPDDLDGAPIYDTLEAADAVARDEGKAVVEVTVDGSSALYGHDHRAASTLNREAIDALTRKQLVEVLEGISIACYDHESDEVLREAVRVNVDDGTLDPENLP